MNKIKTLITKSHGIIRSEINNDLQKTNPLASRGIYLVELGSGVIRGYDTYKYAFDEVSGDIVRKENFGDGVSSKDESSKDESSKDVSSKDESSKDE